MNVEDALKKIGKITEKALEKNPDALTWDDKIKNDKVLYYGFTQDV